MVALEFSVDGQEDCLEQVLCKQVFTKRLLTV